MRQQIDSIPLLSRRLTSFLLDPPWSSPLNRREVSSSLVGTLPPTITISGHPIPIAGGSPVLSGVYPTPHAYLGGYPHQGGPLLPISLPGGLASTAGWFPGPLKTSAPSVWGLASRRREEMIASVNRRFPCRKWEMQN